MSDENLLQFLSNSLRIKFTLDKNETLPASKKDIKLIVQLLYFQSFQLNGLLIKYIY